MNTLVFIQRSLLAASLAGAAVCLAAVLAHHFRNQLRTLHERWLGLGPLGRVATLGLVTVFVVYGSAKSPTNEVTGTGATGVSPVAGQAGTTGTGAMGVSPVAGWVSDGQDAHRPSAIRTSPMMATSPQLLTNQQTNQLTNWTARGAYSDWQRIDFPSSFSFPYGTNLLTSITLFAWGEIREEVKVRGEGEQRNIQVSFEEEERDHHCSPSPSTFTLNLPTAVSLSPGESSVTYGLTPSNSFLIAWQNACVNRSATNRIDAFIEFFASGAIAITTQRPGQAPSTNYQAPTPPPGFFGSDQDNAWALANFPDDYASITNKGYEAWLDEDYVGVSEQNGHYKASITIDQQPTTNNQQPLYLVCGPYKVVVTSPGTYSFPLEVFEHYTARTYPVALPLSITTDDGYRGSLLSGSPAQAVSRPRLALSAPPDVPPEYDIYEEPRLVISPTEIPLNQAVGTHISIWCNIASTARRYGALISREFRLNFCNPSDAEIVAAEVEDLVEIIIDAPLGTCVGTVSITDLHSCCSCGSCTGAGCACGCGCWCHQSSNDTSTNSPSATP